MAAETKIEFLGTGLRKTAIARVRLATGSGKITLEKGTKELDPMTPKDESGTRPEDIEPLSQIIHELNERFGTDFNQADQLFDAERAAAE